MFHKLIVFWLLFKKTVQILLQIIQKAKKGEFMERYVAKEIIVPKNIVYYKHGVIKSMADLFNFVLSAGNVGIRVCGIFLMRSVFH